MDKIYRCIFVYIRQTNLNKYSYKLIPTVWLCMSVNTPMLTVAKLKEGGYGGVTHPPPNSRFRRAQRRFAGQKCGI